MLFMLFSTFHNQYIHKFNFYIYASIILSSVIHEGQWHWPLITDMEYMEIIHTLPRIYGDDDRIVWRYTSGKLTTHDIYRLMSPSGPKLDWTSLLSGSLKILWHMFVLWLAILEKLSTTDKSWLSHLGNCVLCQDGMMESHNHLFFGCRYSRDCLFFVWQMARFSWPNREWARNIHWGSRKWHGKHIINIAYRIVLGSCVYHLCREQNLRRFEHEERHPKIVAHLIVKNVRMRILSVKLTSSVSTCTLYRLWRIPWPVEDTI